MNMNKAWMYNRLVNGFITEEYCDRVEEFVNFAKRHPKCMDGDKLRCPCSQRKCRNTTFRDEITVKVHLGKYGFVPNYYNWYCHGEPYLYESIGYFVEESSAPIVKEESSNDMYCHGEPYLYESIGYFVEESSNDNAMQSMIYDAISAVDHLNMDEIPTPVVQKVDDILKASEREVWEGNPSGHSQLSAIPRLLNIKAENHFSEKCYDEVDGPDTGVTKHAIQPEGTLQRPSNSWELFCNTHRRKNDTFVNARSKAIDDDMTTKVAQTSQPAIEGGELETPSHDVINDRVKALRAENEKLKARITKLEQFMQEFMSRFELPRSLASSSTFPDYSTHDFDSQKTQDPRADE